MGERSRARCAVAINLLAHRGRAASSGLRAGAVLLRRVEERLGALEVAIRAADERIACLESLVREVESIVPVSRDVLGREEVAALASRGMAASDIAALLEMPVGEVELALNIGVYLEGGKKVPAG